ncbi:FN3 associated domain-containing protein [Treponema lecithinolyticum]
MGNKGIVKKWKIAPFINKGTPSNPEWVRLKKSTALDITLNPVTQDFDYIADESPTTELMSYKPSFNQALTMYKGEADYEMVFQKFYELKTGDDAKAEVLIVFFQEEEPAGTFKAWKSEAIISIQNMNAVDSTISFDVLFGGTVKKGTVTLSSGSPVFVENSTKPVKPIIGEVSHNKVTITAESGATIKYTDDGTEPTLTHGKNYPASGIALTQTVTIKAIAIVGGVASDVASKVCTYT